MADQKISQLTGATTPLAGSEVLPIVQSGTTKKVSVANLTAGRPVSASQIAINSSTAPVSKLDVWGTSAVATSQATYVGSIQLNENPTSLSEAGGVEWKAADFGAGYGWKAVTVDSSGVHLVLANRQNSASWTEFYRFSQNGNFTISTGNLIQGTAAKGVNFTANTPAAGMTSQLLNWYETGTFTPVVADAATGGNVAAAATTSGIYTRVGNVVTVQFQASSINTTGMTGGNILYLRGLPFANNASQVANGVVDMRNTAFTDYPTVFLSTSSSAVMLFMHTSGGGVSQVLVSDVTASSLFFVTLTYTV